MNGTIIEAFGEPVLLPSGETCKGVFDIPMDEGKLKALGLDYSRPVLTLHDSDAQPLSANEVLRLRSTDYAVVKKLPDGSGLTKVILSDNQTTNAADFL